jgi:hypothetical protein
LGGLVVGGEKKGSKAAGSGAPSGEGGEAPLWKACFSSKRQRNYYVNRITQERTWHKPEGV